MEVIWLVVAYGLGLVASQVGLPPLVGYLGAGLALAAAGFSEAALLREVGHLGVIFLLFTVGLHLRFRNLLRGEVLGAGLTHIALSALPFAGLAWILGLEPIAALFVGTVLALSSTVVAAKALEDRKALGAYHGRITIGVLVLQDLIAVGLLATLGTRPLAPAAALLLLLPLLRPPLSWLLRVTTSGELRLLLGLLLALGGAGLFAAVGLSDELGALVAGALLAGDARSDDLAERLWGLKEAFLVGFFLEIGLIGLPDFGGWILAGLLVLALPLKAVLFFGLFLAFRLRARTAYLTSASLTSYSEFTLIAGSAGVAAGLLPAAWLVVLTLATAGSFALNALWARYANPVYTRLERHLVALERPGEHPDAQARSLGSARALVVGMGRVGIAAYDSLAEREVRVVGLDDDPGVIETQRRAGRRVIYGDAEDPELWSELEPGALEAVIIAIDDAEKAATAAEALRRRGFTGVINALAMRREESELLEAAGVTTICHPLVQAGVELAESSLRPKAA